ncbi:MAG: hypothetical protein QGF09_09360, partial [Rhodospirillales bacterium]|nr:hypothetical protein [Rhodospirillales bacterium]
MTVPIRSWVAGPVLALSLGALASSFASGGAAVACAFGLVDRAGLLYRAALLVEMPVPANSVEVEFLAHSS